METLIERALGPGVRIFKEVPQELPLVRVDANQLELALLNLAVNARDAMPNGGLLAITARNLPSEVPAQLPPGDYVSISVRDTGEGMAAEVLARAIEPFFTTKPMGKGTGLGLAMVHGFAAQSGGYVQIESRVGEGTTVEIVLPRAAVFADQEPDEHTSARPDRLVHGEATILLVEDDNQVRPVAAAFLRESGYTVVEASSAAAATGLAQTLERLDLLVTDVSMPGEDGISLAARLRREEPGLPVLFITGRPPGPELDNEVTLRKPFSADSLGKAVRERLQR